MNADLIARPYSLLEHLTLGRQLQLCRTTYLDKCPPEGRALLLGDGDGRFLVELARRYRQLELVYVDSSNAMREIAKRRYERIIGPKAHATFELGDASKQEFEGPFHLISAHFFFDCFDQAALEALIQRLTRTVAPGALLLVSDFRIPNRGWSRWMGLTLVALLYRAFRLLTGLRNQRLPDHHRALSQAGFHLLQQRLRCLGLLTAEVWRYSPQDPSGGSVS